MRTLVLNAGSSSLKLSVIGPGDETIAELTGSLSDRDAIERFCREHGPVDATGHRVVHGGTEFNAPVVIDDAVIARLETLIPLAPLHQPAALAAVRIAMDTLPGVPAVACFDTAFHATLPAAASTYAVPAEWRERWGVRRFGFHGLSHAWASARALEITGLARRGSRVVSCHLGAGASACAVRDGLSVDTTMGFTPAEGLVMATRSGSVDPGLLLWLIRTAGLDPAEVDTALERRSGLAALSGTDGDMRNVVDAAGAGDERSRLAIDVWVLRLRQAVAAMTASLGGLDVLVFTGGVGEHQPALRAKTVEGLSFLGVGVDADANARARGDADVSAAGAAGRVVVVSAREDLEIAHLVEATLGRVQPEGEPAHEKSGSGASEQTPPERR
jgi:acetate kinase